MVPELWPLKIKSWGCIYVKQACFFGTLRYIHVHHNIKCIWINLVMKFENYLDKTLIINFALTFCKLKEYSWKYWHFTMVCACRQRLAILMHSTSSMIFEITNCGSRTNSQWNATKLDISLENASLWMKINGVHVFKDLLCSFENLHACMCYEGLRCYWKIRMHMHARIS